MYPEALSWECACGVRHREQDDACWYCGEAREPGVAGGRPAPVRAELVLATLCLRDGLIGQAAVVVGQVFRDEDASFADRFYAHRIRGEVLYAFGNLRAAQRELEAAARIAPRSAAVVYLLGQVTLERWRTARARDLLERATILYGDDDPRGLAHAIHALAYCLDRLGETARADELFARAHALLPDRLPMPCRVRPDTIERMARDALAGLAEDGRGRLGPVSIIVAPYPSRSLFSDTDAGPRAGGVIEGAAPGAACALTLFARNLELGAGDPAALAVHVARVVRREVARYLRRHSAVLRATPDPAAA